jgi:hypothetical protein
MAIRDDFTAGEVLAAADLNDTFASKPPFAYGTATPSTTVEGFIWYDENDTPPAPKFWDGSAFETFGGGKILQIVRATDSTNRSTTSTSFVDASISVTITPQNSDSAVLIVASFLAVGAAAGNRTDYQVTDSSNNAISGAQETRFGATGVSDLIATQTLVAYATPATTSATTYKLRFKVTGGTGQIFNATQTGQMYAIEVSA